MAPVLSSQERLGHLIRVDDVFGEREHSGKEDILSTIFCGQPVRSRADDLALIACDVTRVD